MPLAKELRRVDGPYGRHWRNVVRPAVLKRAGGSFDHKGKYLGGAKCEHCGKPDRQYVWVWSNKAADDQYWTLSMIVQEWHYVSMGGSPGNFRLIGRAQEREAEKIYVKLQCSHLDHTRGNDTAPFKNVAALCGYCHTRLDRQQHKDTRTERKDSQRPVLSALARAMAWGRSFELLALPDTGAGP
jgi:hypothetical protein